MAMCQLQHLRNEDRRVTDCKCPWPRLVGGDPRAPIPSDLWEICREIQRDVIAVKNQATHTNDYLTDYVPSLIKDIGLVRELLKSYNQQLERQDAHIRELKDRLGAELAEVKDIALIINQKLGR